MTAAPSNISVLILEESGAHTDHLLAQLRTERGEPVQWERVNTLPTLREALRRRRDWQLVISDGDVAGLGTFQAIAVAQEVAPGLPVVVLARGGPRETVADVVREWLTSSPSSSQPPDLPEAEPRPPRTQLFDFARRLLEAQEAERRHVAGELHDELGQLLTAIRLNIESAKQRQEQSARNEGIAEALKLIDGALRRVRNFAIELWPTVLDDLGLPAALRWLVENQTRAANLRLRLRVDPLPRLPRAVEVTCFRLVQESLTNAARHASAREVEIQLHAVPGGVDLRVRDDGTGFDVQSVQHRAAHGGPSGFGLLGMQERALMVGGQFHIQSIPGIGTTISARFPVPSAEAAS